MTRDRAAYMREYRARRTARALALNEDQDVAMAEEGFAQHRIAELEEVRHLKAELAQRPAVTDIRPFNTRPFTPVPKK